jgi:phosphohistidine phosphatase
MKTLQLLRHAKSSWKDDDLPDVERPLNKRGRKTAPLMGRFLADGGHLPELIVTSPAVRARETVRLIVESSGFSGRQEIAESLYPTTVEGCLDVLAAIDPAVDSAMLVGHCPGIEEFLEQLTGEYQSLPTCAAAVVRLPLDAWSDIMRETTGELVTVWRPRELFSE